MASKQMIRRVKSALDATYRAWDANAGFADRHPSPASDNDAQWWGTCYQIMQALNRMQIEGRTDREITHAWTALRTEVNLTMALPQFGMFVRSIYPAPRSCALLRCYASHLRAQRRIQIAKARFDLISRQRPARRTRPITIAA